MRVKIIAPEGRYIVGYGSRATGETIDLPGELARSLLRAQPGAFAPVDAPELEDAPGIGPEVAAALRAVGLETLAAVAAATDEQLLAVPGLSRRRLKAVRAYCEEVSHATS